jgi:glycosyltransferase involved in cell wall biosynthesis
MKENLKIACYGFAAKNVGSGTEGDFLILEELLRRGVKIDFYGWRGFTEPKELFEYDNFFYVALPENSFFKLLLTPIAKALGGGISMAIGTIFFLPENYRVLKRELRTNHEREKYDLVLFLGLFAPFRIVGLPCISQAQGPPQSEWIFIQKLRKIIISLCGPTLYIKLMLFYQIKLLARRLEVGYSDFLICGSQWAKQGIIDYGVPSSAIKVLPYPIDINQFILHETYPNLKQGDDKTFLWLGRMDPRKRFDLMLAAFHMLLKERQDVRLKVVGQPGYAAGYGKLIREFEFPEYLDYQPRVDRLKIPALMAECDVLVQPSEGENFGTSVAEALCCGLPVIVGPTNGTKDYVSDSSFIFDEYEPESLKNAMLQAIDALENKRAVIAMEARQAAEKNFNVASVTDGLENIFQEAINLYQSQIN